MVLGYSINTTWYAGVWKYMAQTRGLMPSVFIWNFDQIIYWIQLKSQLFDTGKQKYIGIENRAVNVDQ
jgi:thymidylate synthase